MAYFTRESCVHGHCLPPSLVDLNLQLSKVDPAGSDMVRLAVVEESNNGATTLPDADENQMPTIEGGDTLGRDGDRDKVANVCY